jgi:hypothetical protein
MKAWLRWILFISALLFFDVSPPLGAQDLKFLSQEEYKYLVEEISGDAAYEHLRFYTQFHRPRGGAQGLMEVAQYTERKARTFGLEDVRLIKQASDTVPWNAKRAELWLVEPDVERLADIVQTPLHLADNSRSVDVTAELVDVGDGSAEKDYEGKDVKGKIVLAWGSLNAVNEQAVWKRGALGIVSYADPRSPQGLHYPHQIRWLTLPLNSEDGKPSAFAFGISVDQGTSLHRRLAASSQPFKVHALVESEIGNDNWQVMVEGFIHGTSIHDQDIVLTGHLQEGKYSTNDDGSGCANVLEIARAMVKLIRDGKIKRPKRNIRFWWTTEVGSERQYFADHPDESKKMLANINQDMVGANQGQDILRVQNITRVPFSRFHFLNDIAEAVIDFVVKSNTADLAALQAGTPQPYPKPILSRLGTRHRYNARMVPFHNNTDHMTFTEAPIGVPAITFTNWPDNYIHSTDDDLWNIDRTQLQRNAFAVAAITYIIASAGEAEAPMIATQVYGGAVIRLSEAYKVATGLLVSKPSADRAEAFKRAANQIHQAALRELRAIESVAQLTTSRPALVAALTENLKQLETAYAKDLNSYYKAVTDEANLPIVSYTEKEKELEGIKPVLAAGPKEFLERRGKVKSVKGLHPLMAFEVLNFVDGRRTGVDIYNAVSAEALQAGEYYYGRVTPEMVHELLKNLSDAGLIKIQ